MLDMLYDIRSTLTDYPRWQQYLREQTPPALIVWGENDTFFTADGARAYLDDLCDAELHLLDTGHFVTATHSAEVAELIGQFLGRKLRVQLEPDEKRPRTAGSGRSSCGP